MDGMTFRRMHKSWMLSALHTQNLKRGLEGKTPDKIILDELAEESKVGTVKELLFFPNLSDYLTEEQIETAKLQWLRSIQECREKPSISRCLEILDVLRRAKPAYNRTSGILSEEAELTRKEIIKEFKLLLQKCRKGA